MNAASRDTIRRVLFEELKESLKIEIRQVSESYCSDVKYEVRLYLDGEVISEDTVYV